MKLDRIYKEIKELGIQESSTISEDACKLFEEMGELVQEINKITGKKKFDGDVEKVKINIREESADTLQNLLLICTKFDISIDDLLKEVVKKNKKWKGIVQSKKQKSNSLTVNGIKSKESYKKITKPSTKSKKQKSDFVTLDGVKSKKVYKKIIKPSEDPRYNGY